MEGSTVEKALRGGYVLVEEQNEALTIVSTGSEVSIAVDAAKKLKAEGIRTRVVSLPCWLTFDQQDREYKLSVFRSGAPILSLEAASTTGWQKYSHEVRAIELPFGSNTDLNRLAIRPQWMGCFGSLLEGLREVRYHWQQYVIFSHGFFRIVLTPVADIAAVGKKVVEFYASNGIPAVSPLLKAL